MTDIMKPFITINGTSREELIDQRIEARDGLYMVGWAMRKMMPNERDYIDRPEELKRDREILIKRCNILLEMSVNILDEMWTMQEGKEDPSRIEILNILLTGHFAP